MSSTPPWFGTRYLVPFHWREAALAAPAMPLLIVAGALAGQPVAGATAAGAAFAVGFGAARELRGYRWGAMIAAMLGMTVAAFSGCLLGQDFAIFVGAAGFAAAACAAAALRDENWWWVILQVAIAFLIAGYYAGPLPEATTRGLIVLSGGGVQIGIIALLARAFPAVAAPTILPAPPVADPGMRSAHMLRAAICVAASLVAVHRLGLSNSYWAPMTALLVLKPRLHDTGVRGLARLIGTLAGCIVASAYAHLCSQAGAGADWLLGIGMAGSAMAAYALQKAHYASLTTAITATVVLLLSLGHVAALTNAEHRLVATLVGGGLALGIAWLVPHGRRTQTDGADRVGTA